MPGKARFRTASGPERGRIRVRGNERGHTCLRVLALAPARARHPGGGRGPACRCLRRPDGTSWMTRRIHGSPLRGRSLRKCSLRHPCLRSPACTGTTCNNARIPSRTCSAAARFHDWDVTFFRKASMPTPTRSADARASQNPRRNATVKCDDLHIFTNRRRFKVDKFRCFESSPQGHRGLRWG